MAKVAFSKLGLKKPQEEVKLIKIGNFDIEVKQYLPVNEKLNLVARVLNIAHDEHNFPNPINLEVIGALEIVMAYTNLSFTDKQKEDTAKLYDLLESNGIIDMIVSAIPEEEYNFVIDGIDDTVSAIYNYQNSILGILENVSKDYSQLDFDASNIQQALSDPQNLTLVKDILTKLG